MPLCATEGEYEFPVTKDIKVRDCDPSALYMQNVHLFGHMLLCIFFFFFFNFFRTHVRLFKCELLYTLGKGSR